MAYRAVHTHFWTDPVVRELPPDGKLLFLHLITNPHAHLSGLYYLPIASIAHETGLKPARIETLLQSLSCVQVDVKTGLIWIKRMFAYQGKGEKAQRSAANHLGTLHNSFLIKAFLALYPDVKQFCKNTLLDTVSHTVVDGHAGVGPPNQEKEKDQEKDQKQEQEKKVIKTSAKVEHSSRSATKPEAKSGRTWEAYRQAYVARHRVEPFRNRKTNSALCHLVDMVGGEIAPDLAAYYVSLNTKYYLERRHPPELLAKDYQSIHTQMISGVRVTSLEGKSLEQRDNALAQLERIRAAERVLEGRPHGSA